MSKHEFLEMLREKLLGLPSQDLTGCLDFYSEMIDDRIEDGKTEEEAICEIGTVDEISSQIIADIPLRKLVKERIKPKRRLKKCEILLMALGSPLWLSLAIAAFAVMISIYAVLWSVIVSVWSVFVSLVICSFGGIIAGSAFTFEINAYTGIAMIGVGIFCGGLAIFLFFGCKAATKCIILITKKIALAIKKRLIKKEEI